MTQQETPPVDTTGNTVAATLQRFTASDDFRTGVFNATRAGRVGAYAVVLSEDGWNVIPEAQAGTQYTGPGVLLQLPTLDITEMKDYLESEAGTEEQYLTMIFNRDHEELVDELTHALPPRK